MIKNIILVLSSFLFLISFITTEVNANEGRFSVEAKLPENQVKKDVTYFDLNINDIKMQTIKIKIFNHSDKEITIIGSINRAWTNSNGLVEYGVDENNETIDNNLVHNITDIIKIKNKEIKVGARSEQEYQLNITIPEEYIEGTLAGAITLKEKKERNEDKQKNGVSSEIGYNLAILLHGRALKQLPKLEIFDIKRIEQGTSDVLKMKVINKSPSFINKLSIKTIFTSKDDSKEKYIFVKKDLQVAPNSNFVNTIFLDEEDIPKKKYFVTIIAQSGKKKWHYKSEILVAENRLPNKSYHNGKYNFVFYIYSSFFLFLFLAFYYVNSGLKM